MELNPGSRIGSYEIIALLGAGGMGKVFRARDLQLGREVAIKVLSEEASKDEGRVHRFLTEAKAASALNHPNILTVYGFGEENHSPYIVTELVAGKTLRALLENGPLPTGRVMDISQQTLAGLSKAHGIGIVHRDIKPENLMVSGDNFVKILDFGLAKLLKNEKGSGPLGSLETLDLIATETGLILGTAAYMSPEQARGQPADARSDVFSTGLVIYEMLTGKNPFQRQNFGETISAILRDDPPPFPPSIPQELVRIVEKSVHKEPASRYPSAKEMESDLRKYHTTAITASANSFTSADTIDQLSAPRSAPTTIPVKSGNLTKKSILLASAVILLIVLAIASVRSFKNRAFTPAVPAQPVIAVMAIENATSDPELTSADVGKILSDAFVQILYDYQGVQVVSPLHLTSIITSMNRSFKDTSNDIALVQEVSKESEANTVLSGSLSQIGQSYILTATLTELTSNKLLGSFRAESDGKDHLLEALTAGITPQLNETLSRISDKKIQSGGNVGQVATNSFEAYTHFVKGSELSSSGEFQPAINELQKAVSIDPEMAIAWSMLSCAYSFNGDDARANAAQKKALELKSRMNRKEQLWIDSVSVWLTGNGVAYRKAFERYVREFPDDREGYFYLGLGSQWLEPRNINQAIIDYEKAFHLTPDYYPITKGLVDCYLDIQQREKAISALKYYLEKVRSGYGHDQAKGRLENLVKN